jgi:hypothetical protein
VMGLLRLWKCVENLKGPTRKSDVWAPAFGTGVWYVTH